MKSDQTRWFDDLSYDLSRTYFPLRTYPGSCVFSICPVLHGPNPADWSPLIALGQHGDDPYTGFATWVLDCRTGCTRPDRRCYLAHAITHAFVWFARRSKGSWMPGHLQLATERTMIRSERAPARRISVACRASLWFPRSAVVNYTTRIAPGTPPI